MAKNSFTFSQFGFLLVVVLIAMTYYRGVVAEGRQVCDGNILGRITVHGECRNCVGPCRDRFNNVVRILCAPLPFNQIECFCCGPVTTHESLETS
ncbi:hypothetical protein MKW92_041456 [Papaver armeniacum]|nr:hypothetical protein MKW92_008822 [Papaver armeniacum]KAI3942319.1 hypothetical protein MKW92_041456 [Papaver armeniacum]